MSLSLFTNWAVGLINGYKQKENGLPNGIKYGTIGVTTGVAMLRTLANFDTPNIIKMTSGQKMAGLFIGVPLLMGTNFCVGHHMGKAIRWAEDDPRPSKNGVRIQLL
jgi:hypothetical protein